MAQINGVHDACEKSTQYSIHSRRCFMTGELCSKQSHVHREREKLHKENHINAFVVMNFSDMSDVVYKWKLRPFIESLKEYLYLKKETANDTAGGKKTTAIACVADPEDDEYKASKDWESVKEIHVIRADSDTESNYVICDRVCQQMQIADLIIVDVSVENTNVFYEFGMAAAFGKLILPICYNESFYQMHIPEAAKEFLEEQRIIQAKKQYTDENPKENPKLESLRKMIEHHIDGYPWRRRLFEFYGLRYRKSDSKVGYTYYKDITNPVFGFSDVQYARFPYDHQMDHHAEPLGAEKPKDWKEKTKKGNPYDYDVVNNDDRKKVGYHLYNRLRASYNQKDIKDEEKSTDNAQKDETKVVKKSPYNTLVVYTMDSVLNGEQAGQCIINYYRNMTARIQEEHCFCGDRVGILGQGSKILDDPKDTKTDQKLLYHASDIIRIGMNEATHMALQKKIKTEDFLKPQIEGDKKTEGGKTDEDHEEILRCVKAHIRNRCIPAYPDEPIYIDQLKNGVQRDVLKLPEQDRDARMYFFSLFDVMLHTLRYTNEIVVDLSRNSLQALFWLGVAHGSDAHAITVRYVPNQQELERSGEQNPAGDRHIFDVAGLWTAILSSNDTEGFYQQLTKAQLGIEQSNKLILPDSEKYLERVMEQYHAPSPYMKGGYTGFQNLMKTKPEAGDAQNMLRAIQENERLCKIWDVLTEQSQRESKQLESYYRTCFWRRMLRQNALQLYIQEKKGRIEETNQPCRVNISWDVNATAELSHYLSKRLMIGSYRQTMLREGDPLPDAKKQNFISIGGKTQIFAQEGAKAGLTLVDYVRGKGLPKPPRAIQDHRCNEPTQPPEKCCQQLAQLLLWREATDQERKEMRFWVSLVGVSGPATLALTSLLINPVQQEELFQRKGKKTEAQPPRHLLNRLQTQIRKKFLKEFNDLLEKEKIESKHCHAANLYLSTVLYQFFFPFLTRADEKRITNGMEAFLVENEKLTGGSETGKKVIDALETTMKKLNGVEALYTVTVECRDSDADNRWPKNIEPLKTGDKPEVYCLFNP